ncbi:MAG: radical SAM protein [Byssovorax sp.]
MKVQEIALSRRLVPQKLSARDTPHATIEPNTTCNIRCARCYCIEQPVVKPFAEVKAEIDLALARRRLDALSLLGGEPTLHPDLPAIVRYVKQKGLVCMVLTNGVRFLDDPRDPLLDELLRAGVDRFLVHIDEGQKHVHGDIDAARHRLFDLLDARKVCYGLSLTLYPGREAELPRVMRRFAHHPYLDGALCTLSFDLDHAFDPAPSGSPRASMREAYRAIGDVLRIEPAAYLPSSTSDDEVSWLMYFYFIDAETGDTFAISPALNRAMKAIFRRIAGRELFAETVRPSAVPGSFVAAAAGELLLHPGRAKDLVQLFHRGHRVENLRFHYLVVQEAPRWDAEHGKVQICWQCPDAVVRNGTLVPVCIAGRVSPLEGRPPTAPPAVVEEIARHLGGAG